MPSEAMWYVGQKVVCVDAQFPSQFFEWGNHTPVQDGVYTIRRISQGCHGVTGQKALSFLLEEIVNPDFGTGKEVMFSAHRFRPLDRRESGREAAAGSIGDTAGVPGSRQAGR